MMKPRQTKPQNAKPRLKDSQEQFETCFLTSQDELKFALKNGLYQTVYDCFSPPPFNEEITPKKVKYHFSRYLDLGDLYLAYTRSKYIGFIASLPLLETENVGEFSVLNTWVSYQGQKRCLNSELLTELCKLPVEQFYYVACLGVSPYFRRQGIAKQLFQVLLSQLDSSFGYLLRATENPDYRYIIQFYQGLGFKPLPVQQTVNYRTAQGKVITDERLIAFKPPGLSSTGQEEVKQNL